MEVIKWKPVYTVGIDSVDEQHKKLFSLINDLYTAFLKKSPPQTYSRIINELLDYAVYHFDNEARLFLATNYPQRNEHLKEHLDFKQKALRYKTNFEDRKLNISYELINFLKNWLEVHILNTDKEFGVFYKQYYERLNP